MLSDAIKFLETLHKNNNREWFNANKSEFKKIEFWFHSFVQELIDEITDFDLSVTGVTAKESVFRIYRDIRFSKDKTPYKTHLSVAISCGSELIFHPVYYFSFNHKSELFVGGGEHQPESKRLSQLRQAILKKPESLRQVLTNTNFKNSFDGFYGDSLKTAPRGVSKDHPDLDLLRQKDFVAARTLLISDFDESQLKMLIIDHFQALQPLIDWLKSIK